MSRLAEILSNQEPAAVHRWASALPSAQVDEMVTGAGWHFGHVDGDSAASKREFLTALGTALEFPEHYGVNLDALADCLDDLVAQPGPGVLLLWDAWGELARRDRRTFDVTLEILRDASARARRPFAVLLRGDGPCIDGLAEPQHG